MYLSACPFVLTMRTSAAIKMPRDTLAPSSSFDPARGTTNLVHDSQANQSWDTEINLRAPQSTIPIPKLAAIASERPVDISLAEMHTTETGECENGLKNGRKLVFGPQVNSAADNMHESVSLAENQQPVGEDLQAHTEIASRHSVNFAPRISQIPKASARILT